MAGPLTGLKVLDFTTLLPGPYATMVLAGLGADVLQVVSRSRPDLTATLTPAIPGTELTASGAWLGRDKRSMFLNLKNRAAIEVVHRLVMEYDIIFEQFRPGVMDRLGLGYEDLRKLNPKVIYCSMTGYGQTGPLNMHAGHDINYLARSGVMAYSGRKESGPTLTCMQIADVASGSANAVAGTLAAVVHRFLTGEGQHVDVAMMDGVVAFNAFQSATSLVNGEEPGREGGLLNGGSLYDFYQTKDGEYLSVGALEPQFFSAFCNAIDCPELIAAGVMPENVAEIKERVRQVIRTKSRREWEGIFEKVDACVEPVLSLTEALSDPHLQQRKMVVEVPLPDKSRSVGQIGIPITFSKSVLEYRQTGVVPGTNTKEVMLALGYTEQQIAEFDKNGTFD